MCRHCVRADRREAEGRPAEWQRRPRISFQDAITAAMLERFDPRPPAGGRPAEWQRGEPRLYFTTAPADTDTVTAAMVRRAVDASKYMHVKGFRGRGA